MSTIARVAAIAGSLVAAAAVAAAIVLPVHHTPVSAATSGQGTGAVTQVSASPSIQQSSGAGVNGQAGSGSASGSSSSGSGSGSGQGSGSGHGSGSGQGSGSGNGSGSGSGSGSGNTGGVPTLPAPTGTVGTPNVPCLIGYTWRKAFPGDWVCVSPATAAQAQADNAAAESLIQPGGGPYGPYTCRQGYVWRQVVPNDYTCVDNAVRTQAWYDNSQAASRVAFLRLCTQGYSQGLFQYIAIDGNAFNFGPVELQVRHTGTGTLVWSGQVTATSIAGLPGGSFYYDTPVLMVPAGQYYIVALDVSGRYSSQFPVPTYCV